MWSFQYYSLSSSLTFYFIFIKTKVLQWHFFYKVFVGSIRRTNGGKFWKFPENRWNSLIHSCSLLTVISLHLKLFSFLFSDAHEKKKKHENLSQYQDDLEFHMILLLISWQLCLKVTPNPERIKSIEEGGKVELKTRQGVGVNLAVAMNDTSLLTFCHIMCFTLIWRRQQKYEEKYLWMTFDIFLHFLPHPLSHHMISSEPQFNYLNLKT